MKRKSLISMLVVIFWTAFSHTASAQSADDLKKQSMQACEAQAAQLSAEQKEAVLAVCKCTTENTDYDQLIKDINAGNTAKAQESSIKVAQECQAKAEKG